MKVGVIDYGVGNLGSLCRALELVKARPVLIDRPIDLHNVNFIILPGVGSFTSCAINLETGGWVTALREEVLGYKRPLLGICVGMQLLANYGNEGALNTAINTIGLGFIPGHIEHISNLGCNLRIPHVGWNNVKCIDERKKHSFFFSGIPDDTDFYFVHSYAFVPYDQSDVICTTEYSVNLTAAIARDNIWGTQFHPEKSSRAGLRVLRNFVWGANA